jgi:hypothetical protein
MDTSISTFPSDYYSGMFAQWNPVPSDWPISSIHPIIAENAFIVTERLAIF